MTLHSTYLYDLIQRLAYSFDDCKMGTPDSGSTSTCVDLERTETDDYWNGGQIHFYTGTHTDTSRDITDFANTTGTITFAPVVTASVDTTDKYQVHKKFRYEQYKSAIDRAVDTLKTEYLLNKKDDTAIMNRLTNYSFEGTGSGATTGWTAGGTGASIAASATVAANGAYSLRLTVGSTTSYAYQSVSNFSNYRSKSMTLRCWVYCSTASKAYITCSDGTTTHTSDYNSAASEWEELSVTFTVDDEPTQLIVYLNSLTGPTYAYFDHPILIENTCYEVTLPTGFRYISEVWYESSPESGNFDCLLSDWEWWIVKDGTTPIMRLGIELPVDTGFRLIGQAVQDDLSADSSACYIPPEPIIQYARALLMQGRMKEFGTPEVRAQFEIATMERRMAGITVLPGSKSVWEN